MANKYIRHGETFNGDGTSSAAATVDGGVGAWNSLNVFDSFAAPNYGGGSLAAGDVVYIRSKDAGGADITRTIAANTTLGNASASSGAWIDWVVDNGVVWPGINGSVTYTHASSYQISPRIYNRYTASEKGNLKVVVTGTSSPNVLTAVAGGAVVFEKVIIDCSGQTGAGAFNIGSAAGQLDFINCEFLIFKIGSYGFYLNAPEGINLYDSDIRIDAVGGTKLFTLNDYCDVRMFGGSIYGSGANSGLLAVASVTASYSCGIRLVGTKYPTTMPLTATNPYLPHYVSAANSRTVIESVFGDGLFGAEIHMPSGVINSRNDGFYPSCNAVFPDDNNTPWSWYVYPRGSLVANSRQIVVSKFFSGASASKTVTLNFLLSNAISGANKGNVWIEVDYIDSSDNRRFMTSRDISGSALDVSTATWSTTSYGPIFFDKKQIAITTAYAVKQNTMLNITVHYSKGVGSTNDILFVCPEVLLT